MAKLSFKLGGRSFSFMFRTWRELNQYVGGITNRCVGGRYVVFLDFDGVPFEWVAEELVFLQEEHDLSTFHVFETGGGFHAVCTDKLSLKEYVDILRDSSTDDAYLWVSLRRARKVWTLRVTEKNGASPFYVRSFVRDCEIARPRSAPHNHLLRKLYNIVIPRDFEDGEKSFIGACYHIAGDKDK